MQRPQQGYARSFVIRWGWSRLGFHAALGWLADVEQSLQRDAQVSEVRLAPLQAGGLVRVVGQQDQADVRRQVPAFYVEVHHEDRGPDEDNIVLFQRLVERRSAVG